MDEKRVNKMDIMPDWDYCMPEEPTNYSDFFAAESFDSIQKSIYDLNHISLLISSYSNNLDIFIAERQMLVEHYDSILSGCGTIFLVVLAIISTIV